METTMHLLRQPKHLLFILLFFVVACTKEATTKTTTLSVQEQITQSILFKNRDAQQQLSKLSLSDLTTEIQKTRSLHTNDLSQSYTITLQSSPTTPLSNKESWQLGTHIPVQHPDSTYPLIIYLHGGINTTRADKGKESYTMMSFLYDSIPCFVASPSGNRNARWWEPRGIERILFTLRFMLLNYPIDPQRIILAGVSDGGTATFALASLPNSPFSDYWAISGFPPLLPQLGVDLNIELLKKRSFYMANGGNDRLYPTEQIQQFVTQAQNAGISIDFSFYPKAEHGFDYKAQEFSKLAQRITTIRAQSLPPITTTHELFNSLNRTNLLSF